MYLAQTIRLSCKYSNLGHQSMLCNRFQCLSPQVEVKGETSINTILLVVWRLGMLLTIYVHQSLREKLRQKLLYQEPLGLGIPMIINFGFIPLLSIAPLACTGDWVSKPLRSLALVTLRREWVNRIFWKAHFYQALNTGPTQGIIF